MARGLLPWLVVVGAAACSQPTGIVLSLRGVETAEALLLGVGENGGEGSYRVARETGVIELGGPYRDGFEIYLHREDLLGQRKLALVLDATLPQSGDGRVPLRATYEVAPSRDELIEVRLEPVVAGSGQWVCQGRPQSDGDGFVISDEPERDCDRDGWLSSEDPEDVDPLAIPDASDLRLRLAPGKLDGKCALALGRNLYEGVFDRVSECNACAGRLAELMACVDANDVVDCRVGASGRYELGAKELLELASNARLTLVHLAGPADAYFVPSASSLKSFPDAAKGQWRVAFERRAGAPALFFAQFLLTDHAVDPPRHQLVRVRFDPGEASSCEDRRRRS